MTKVTTTANAVLASKLAVAAVALPLAAFNIGMEKIRNTDIGSAIDNTNYVDIIQVQGEFGEAIRSIASNFLSDDKLSAEQEDKLAKFKAKQQQASEDTTDLNN